MPEFNSAGRMTLCCQSMIAVIVKSGETKMLTGRRSGCLNVGSNKSCSPFGRIYSMILRYFSRLST